MPGRRSPNLAALQELVPAAIEHARSYLTVREAEYAARVDTMLAPSKQRVTEWEQLALDIAKTARAKENADRTAERRRAMVAALRTSGAPMLRLLAVLDPLHAEELQDKLRNVVFAAWATRESDENDTRKTPRQLLRTLRAAYFAPNMRAFLAERAEAAADAVAEGRPHEPDAELNKAARRVAPGSPCRAGGFLPCERERAAGPVDRVSVRQGARDHRSLAR